MHTRRPKIFSSQKTLICKNIFCFSMKFLKIDPPYMDHVAASISSNASSLVSMTSLHACEYYNINRIMKCSWFESQLDDGSGNRAFQNAPKWNNPFIQWHAHSSFGRAYSLMSLFLACLFMVDLIQKEFHDFNAYTAHNPHLSIVTKFL